MVGRVAVGLGVAVLVLAGWLLWTCGELKEARSIAATWKQAAQAAEIALEELKKQAAVTEAALQDRQSRLDALSRQRLREQTALREAQHDKAVDDWARAAVPDAVVRVLQAGPAASAADRQSHAAGTSHNPNTGTGIQRPDEQ